MPNSTEIHPVDVVVRLPEQVAHDIEAVRRTDPDFLGRAIQYALARKVVFDELHESLTVPAES